LKLHIYGGNMGNILNKSEFYKLKESLGDILSENVEKIAIGENIPSLDILNDSNTPYKADCAVLFIDIRDSTGLIDEVGVKNAVKIYRSFMKMAVRCVRSCGGNTRQFLGDRIMGVFLDDNSSNNIPMSAVEKALNAAKSMNTVLDYTLNPLIFKNCNKKYLTCGIGIGYGRALITKVGMKSKGETREWGDVWVGNVTNYASKYADLAKQGEIFIGENAYSKLKESVRSEYNFNVEKRYKNGKYYSGYITRGQYLEYFNDLGDKFEYPTTNVEIFSFEENIFNSIPELNELSKKLNNLEINLEKRNKELIEKEKELIVLDEKLKNKSNELNNKEISLNADLSYCYLKYCNLLSSLFLQKALLERIGYIKYFEMVDKTIELGVKLGNSELNVKTKISAELVDSCHVFGNYAESYEYMIIMAEYWPWINIIPDVIKKIGKPRRLIVIIENRIKKLPDGQLKEKFKGYIKELESIKCN